MFASLLVVALLAQDAPAFIDRLATLDDAAAARAVAADPAATRAALDGLIAKVDASVHSDRKQPEQRRVEFDESSLALGRRVSRMLASATGDRVYLRRFAARTQRLDGTRLLNDRKYRSALAPLTAALREARALDDRWLETITHVNLAYAHLELGRGEQAVADCKAALAIARTLDARARALALLNLGSAYLHIGKFEPSIEYSNQAVAASREAGIRLWEGNSLLNLGGAHHRLGHLEEARQAFEQALAVLEKTNDRLGIGRTLYNLGLLASDGRPAEAVAYLERALPIIRSVDIRHSHSIELERAKYQNPYELSALQMLVSASVAAGDEQRAATYQAELRRVEAMRPAPAAHHPKR